MNPFLCILTKINSIIKWKCNLKKIPLFLWVAWLNSYLSSDQGRFCHFQNILFGVCFCLFACLLICFDLNLLCTVSPGGAILPVTCFKKEVLPHPTESAADCLGLHLFPSAVSWLRELKQPPPQALDWKTDHHTWYRFCLVHVQTTPDLAKTKTINWKKPYWK